MTMGWELEKTGEAQIFLHLEKIVGKQRPRMTKGGHVYTPKETEDAEKLIRGEWLKQHGTKYAGHEGPIYLDVTTRRELVKSNPKRNAGRSDTGKPDFDNVLKLVCDALNGIAYQDDKQIVYSSMLKLPRLPHGEGNRMMVTVQYYEDRWEDD